MRAAESLLRNELPCGGSLPGDGAYALEISGYGAGLVPQGPSHHCRRAIYSVRKAFIGSIDAARLAGRAAESKATNAIRNVPPNKVNGSNGLTPKS